MDSQSDPTEGVIESTPGAGVSGGPVRESDRIESLDVLRGFAVLGILTMNIGAFAMPSAAYFDPTAWGDLSGLNFGIWLTTHLLADLKFMAIFSMLFGAGIILMAERREARGAPTTGLQLRRMAWLLLFGALHAHLLWYGDVLFWYALCGTGLYFVRRARPRRLVIGALGFWGFGSLILLAGGFSSPGWPPDVMAETLVELKPSAEVLAHEVEHYRGGWFEQMQLRHLKALDMETATFLSWAVWRVSGLMLLGMALFKWGVLSGRATPATYRKMIAAGVLVGLPLVALGVRRNFAADWEAPGYFFFGSLYNYWGSIPVALGWIGAVMLVVRSGVLAALTRRLAAVGRMAFTNYIMQTVICTMIFYGHGLGLFGSVERTGQAGIMLGVWLFQLWLSPVWLRHFLFGPLEWLWRSLVYLEPQPMRRIAA